MKESPLGERVRVALKRLLNKKKKSRASSAYSDPNLILSEHFTSSVIDSSLDMIIATDNERRIILFNKAAETTFEYPASEMLGKHVGMLYASPSEAARVGEVMRAQGRFSDEVLNRRSNGEIFPSYLSASILQGPNNEVLGVVGVSRDISIRKRSERQLIEKELFYHTLYEGAHDAIFTMNNDIFIDCNQMTLSVFGLERKWDIVGHHPWEFSPEIQPDGRVSKDAAAEKITAALKGTPQRFYWQHRRMDGTTFDTEVSLSRIALKEFVLLQAIVRDITDQWRAREAVRVSEMKYRNIVNNAPVGFYQTNIQGNFITANATMARMLGYDSPEELCARNIATDVYFNEADRSRLIREYDSVDIGKDIEVQWKKKDGTPLWVQMNIHTARDANGRIVNFDGFVRDISEKKKTEDALRESETRYRTLFDRTLDGVYRSTHDGRFVHVNAAMAAMFGYDSVEQMMKVDIKKELYFSPDDRESEVLDEENEQIEEYLMRRKDGTPIWVEDHGRYIFDEQGNIQFHEGMVRDITDRKRAERILRESEARFKTVFEHNPVMIAVVGTDRRVIDINETAEIQLGYPRSEVVGEDVQKVFFEEDKRIVLEQFSLLLSKKVDQSSWKIRKVRKDGRVIWVNENARLMRWTGDKEVVLITCEDVTKQKEKEDVLRKIEEENRAIVDAVPDLIFRLSQDGTFLDFRNPAQMPLFSPPQEFLGKKLHESLPSPLASLIMEKMQEALREKRMIMFECDLEMDRELRHYENRIVVLDNGEVMSFVRDITERRRSVEALWKSEFWLRESQRVARIGSYDFDIVGDSWKSSPVLDEIFGLLPDDVRNYTSWTELIHPDDREEMMQYFKSYVLGAGRPFNKEYRVIRKSDGVLRWVWGLGELSFGTDGRPYRMIGTIQDITERLKLQHQLIQLEKVQSIGTLAGGIAHDFNNILSIILAYATRLRRDKPSGDQLAEDLTKIKNAAERGSSLVRQILTFARKADVSFAPIDLTDLIHDLSSMLRETFIRTVVIEEVFKAEIPMVNADKSQMHQALLNLCVNARDAMPNGGTITISANTVTRKQMLKRFTEAEHPKYVQIAITDTGMGMDEGTKQKIFDPFFTTKDKGKGTGLGLPVVFGILQTHGGFIDVESEPGKGSTFYLYLPAILGKKSSVFEEDSTDLLVTSGGSETILLVEDEEELRAIVKDYLNRQGYKVVEAGDGKKAVGLYRDMPGQIHLVLSDIGLPLMSGIEAFHQIKETDPSVKVIIASGYFEPDMRVELSMSGVKDFIQKPYRMDDVLQKVRSVLDQE